MPERLIQIIVPADQAHRLRELIDRTEDVESWHDASVTTRLFAVQVPAERVEAVFDPIQAAFGTTAGFRVFVLPVEAALPRRQEPGADEASVESEKTQNGAASSRISREELHADLSEHAHVTRVFLALVSLSTIVAAARLRHDLRIGSRHRADRCSDLRVFLRLRGAGNCATDRPSYT